MPAVRRAVLLLVLALCIAFQSPPPLFAAKIKIAWDRPRANGAIIAGYRVHYADVDHYIGYVDVGNVTEYTFQNLKKNGLYFFAVIAYNPWGREGGMSNMLAAVVTDSLPYDPDKDGVADDGDGSGIAGDNFCRAQVTQGCDDNCPGIYNPGQEDSDGDGAGDLCDNCVRVFNPDQKDSNVYEDDNISKSGVQHYGDKCDPDFDNDGTVTLPDYVPLQQYYRQNVPPAPAYLDIDGDGVITLSDMAESKKYYRNAPGPGLGD